MSLEEQSKARKERLEALRKRKLQHDQGISSNGTNGHSEVFRFRNYDPSTGAARRHDPTQDEQDTVEKQVEGLVERTIKEDEEKRAQELDLLNIQPKKPNWDLKRDLDKKLAKLQSKTDSAIGEIIRERLQKKGSDIASQDIATQVARREQEGDSDSSDED